MKITKGIILVLLALAALFFAIGLFLPRTYHVERSAVVAYPVEQVFTDLINYDLRTAWDPWYEQDSTAEVTVTGPVAGIGSSWSWKGEIVGEGSETIVDIIRNEMVKTRLEFTQPRGSVSDLIWKTDNLGDSTRLTWMIDGGLKYPVEVWAGLFMNKMLGKSFERGLDNFSRFQDERAALLAKGLTGEISETIMDPFKYLAIRSKIRMEEISARLGEYYGEMMALIRQSGDEVAGMPFTRYYSMVIDGMVDMEACIPVNRDYKTSGRIQFRKQPSFRALTAKHFGPYSSLPTTYNAMMAYMNEKGTIPTGIAMEIYSNDPASVKDPMKLETLVVYPVK